ncbi:hypothetical protein IAR55_006523 [Kwoniella newhampshirensis]|uniref:Mitochondrial distribution and morphology protein 34 n=1 Tax=Kwoniella newhampshirensis TaxID=1651941 RepID=A0AAW0YUB8_9TREE
MGYTVQLHWTFTPPPGRSVSVADIVLPRVLEHYGLHAPSRTALQFRTYRAQFPSSTSSSPPMTRYLTTITSLSPPNPPIPSSSTSTSGAIATRDDVTYLFLDDRILSSAPVNLGGPSTTTSGPGPGPGSGPGAEESTSTPMDVDVPTSIRGKESTSTVSVVGDNGGTTMDEDGFEIIDIPPGEPESSSAQQGSNDLPPQQEARSPVVPDGIKPTISLETSSKVKEEKRRPKRFRCLAVRPSAAVLPMLQSLSSPFVMGLTKAARAQLFMAASTVSPSPVIPTPLPGTSLLLTTLNFPPLSPPLPPIILRVFIVPNTLAQSIFLEAEYQSTSSSRRGRGRLTLQEKHEQDAILREFLEGCLVEEIGGEKKITNLDDLTEADHGWDGVERQRRSMFALARTLRESGFI